ncbi:hypothetical protein PANDA_015364 [Ailuropoda melanoleuca]|uniref:Stum, mechanosensory transduction mediator homolog n=1 Tax=Ailuropoda melanoleuca TaxID=9646 RepID=D2HT96_AILME|nr:hypothetical protein PANDA_015364 [Ailuropoda melanoleuca]
MHGPASACTVAARGRRGGALGSVGEDKIFLQEEDDLDGLSGICERQAPLSPCTCFSELRGGGPGLVGSSLLPGQPVVPRGKGAEEGGQEDIRFCVQEAQKSQWPSFPVPGCGLQQHPVLPVASLSSVQACHAPCGMSGHISPTWRGRPEPCPVSRRRKLSPARQPPPPLHGLAPRRSRAFAVGELKAHPVAAVATEDCHPLGLTSLRVRRVAVASDRPLPVAGGQVHVDAQRPLISVVILGRDRVRCLDELPKCCNQPYPPERTVQQRSVPLAGLSVGTFVSAFAVLCGARTDLPDRHVCCVFWLNIAAALIQTLTAIVMVGWIMSIFWGMDMVILATGCKAASPSPCSRKTQAPRASQPGLCGCFRVWNPVSVQGVGPALGLSRKRAAFGVCRRQLWAKKTAGSCWLCAGKLRQRGEPPCSQRHGWDFSLTQTPRGLRSSGEHASSRRSRTPLSQNFPGKDRDPDLSKENGTLSPEASARWGDPQAQENAFRRPEALEEEATGTQTKLVGARSDLEKQQGDHPKCHHSSLLMESTKAGDENFFVAILRLEHLCKGFVDKVEKTGFEDCFKSFADRNVTNLSPHSRGSSVPQRNPCFQKAPPPPLPPKVLLQGLGWQGPHGSRHCGLSGLYLGRLLGYGPRAPFSATSDSSSGGRPKAGFGAPAL